MSRLNSDSKMRKYLLGRSCAKEIILTGLAELLGTGTLVFLGCMGCVGGLSEPPKHLQITLNFGLAVMIVIQCFGHISHAHVNPAMTVGSVVLGIKSVREGMFYFLAQIIGSVLGFGLLKAITPASAMYTVEPAKLAADNVTVIDTFCVTDINSAKFVDPMSGLLIEGIATFILMLIACAVWDPRNSHNTDSTAIKFGLSVTALATAVGPYTGCSMNPVRSFAPALWNNYWSNHYIYWLGPLGGALLASLAYKTIFWPKDEDDEDTTIPENVALNSVDLQKAEHM